MPSEDSLPTQCPTVQRDIPYCQSIGKKILLSLGGGAIDYALTGVDEGIALADFLWGAYGPLTPEWVAAGGLRPLDRGLSNTDTSAYYQIDIDGFDFDIEAPSAGNFPSMLTMMSHDTDTKQMLKRDTLLVLIDFAKTFSKTPRRSISYLELLNVRC